MKEKRRRTEEPEVRRSQILEAAKSCFRQSGFQATTIAQIASEAGISVGLIYQFFPSKEALIEGISFSKLDDQFEQLDNLCRDNALNLYEIGRIFAGDVLDNNNASLMLEITAEASRNSKIREFISDKQQRIISRLADDVRAAAGGSDAVDLEERLRLILALFWGVTAQIVVEGPKGKERLIERMTQMARSLAEPEASL